jgi:CheY-like chemotaxis protein
MAFISTVLCIDDDLDDLMFIKEAITAHSCEMNIVEATNGKAALDYLKDAKQNGKLPCLIIMDINMPKMDGKSTLPLIKEDHELAKIPLVVFTTSSSHGDRKFFEAFGVHYFTKPNHYSVFLKKVREMLTELTDLQ